ATIPLSWAAARLWLKDANAARWAAAVAAVLPVPAYFGLTEVHMVPGAFFLILTIAVLGLALRWGSPPLMFSAGLWAIVTSQAYPTLMIVPVIVLACVASLPEGRSLLRRPWIWIAGVTTFLIWLLPAIGYLQLLGNAESTGVFGPGYFDNLHPLAPLMPSFGFSWNANGNVFLNPSYTPPLFAIAALVGAVFFRGSSGQRAPVLVFLAMGLLLTLLNSLSGNMDTARIQLIAMPFFCIAAGVGLSWLTERLTSLLGGRVLVATGSIGIIFAASVAIWPGQIGQVFTPQAEARAFRELLPRVPKGCLILSNSWMGRYIVWLPSYYLTARPDLKLLRAEGPDIPPALREAKCVVYFRSTACFDQSHVPEERGSPTTADGKILPCAALEDSLGLQPLALKEIPARPDCRQLFTRQRIPVGFFRVTRLPQNMPEGSYAPNLPKKPREGR
ncbi:MAG: hypothetical protein RBU30_10650, partial [Polyangia bacterium]|nr:hypothetical protein [Polyangia bacterium]